MPHSYDYRKLRGRIKEKFGTQAEFSKRLGISEVSVSNKLNNVVDWGQEEMVNEFNSFARIPFQNRIFMLIFLLTKLRKTQHNNKEGR